MCSAMQFFGGFVLRTKMHAYGQERGLKAKRLHRMTGEETELGRTGINPGTR